MHGIVEGVGLYVRHITGSRRPRDIAKQFADHGLRWAALGVLWQEEHEGRVRSRFINKPDRLRSVAEALEEAGVRAWYWGYPWQGEEQHFVDVMTAAAAPTGGRVLMDPELGSNPTRSSSGLGKRKADLHAERLVELFAQNPEIQALYLSTFGNGWRIGWFPLLAFTRALVKHFGGRAGIGGQTYTDNGRIDMSIADMQKVILKAGGVVARPGDAPAPGQIEVVPNFGTYRWNTANEPRTPGAKAIPKSPIELRAHLYEFVDEDEPVDALIGWAENFMNRALWDELARFADAMARGACRLPRRGGE